MRKSAPKTVNPTTAVETAAPAQTVFITLEKEQRVSGLLQTTPGAIACLVLAHGAGAGMRHPFLAQVASGLIERRIGSLRYQFPYMEQGSNRPDSPPVAQGTVRSAVSHAKRLCSETELFAGGKSFGGRMTSQAQAASPLPGVRGLIFLGFPLHPPGRPSTERARHLLDVDIPMLFLQGDHDEFAELPLLRSVTDELGSRATLKLFPEANHSFHVPARTGRKDSDVMAEILDTVREWMQKVISQSHS